MTTLKSVIFVLTLITLASCVSVDVERETATNTKKPSTLSMDDALMVRIDKEGDIFTVSDATYKQGADVTLLMQNVRGYSIGKDGKYNYNADIEVRSQDGKSVATKKGYIGKQGNVLPAQLQKGIYGTIETSKFTPGRYDIIITVYDNVGNGKLSVTKKFVLT